MYDKHVLYCRFVIYIISELWYWNKLHHKERLRCHECARYTLSNQHCKYNKLVRIKRQKWLIKPIACDCLAKKKKNDCNQTVPNRGWVFLMYTSSSIFQCRVIVCYPNIYCCNTLTTIYVKILDLTKLKGMFESKIYFDLETSDYLNNLAITVGSFYVRLIYNIFKTYTWTEKKYKLTQFH